MIVCLKSLASVRALLWFKEPIKMSKFPTK